MTTPQKRKPIKNHDTHSKRLFQHAQQELEKGNRLEAAEKAWGAVSHRVKAIANRMGWNYNSHVDFHKLRHPISQMTSDPLMTELLLDKAFVLHNDYHYDARTLDVLRDDFVAIRHLLDLLDGPELTRPVRPKPQNKRPPTLGRRQR